MYPYVLTEAGDVEEGNGTATKTGGVWSFSRDTVMASKIANVAGTAKMSLNGGAILSISPLAADLIAGTSANQLVRLDATAKLPAVDASQLTNLIAVPVGTLIMYPGKSAPEGYLKRNGAAYSSTSYAALFAVLVQSAAVTSSIAAPGVITWAGHPLNVNDPVKFTTTGALPTGLTAGDNVLRL